MEIISFSERSSTPPPTCLCSQTYTFTFTWIGYWLCTKFQLLSCFLKLNRCRHGISAADVRYIDQDQTQNILWFREYTEGEILKEMKLRLG